MFLLWLAIVIIFPPNPPGCWLWKLISIFYYVIESESISHSVMSDQAPLSMEFSRQEYCSGLPFPLKGIFPTVTITHLIPLYHNQLTEK